MSKVEAMATAVPGVLLFDSGRCVGNFEWREQAIQLDSTEECECPDYHLSWKYRGQPIQIGRPELLVLIADRSSRVFSHPLPNNPPSSMGTSDTTAIDHRYTKNSISGRYYRQANRALWPMLIPHQLPPRFKLRYRSHKMSTQHTLHHQLYLLTKLQTISPFHCRQPAQLIQHARTPSIRKGPFLRIRL
jgi:hypothetical protein